MRFLTLILFFAIGGQLMAQINSIDSQVEENFAFKVKHIDEFFERFNDYQQTSSLSEYLANNYPDYIIEREKFLSRLFDQESENLDMQLVHEFVSYVADTANSIVIDFNDHDWYAEVDCIFEHENIDKSIQLILQYIINDNGSSKWIIAGVNGDLYEVPESTNPTTTLNPVSYGTDFVGLYRAMKDQKNVKNYISKTFEPDQLTLFVLMWINNQLVLKEKLNTMYHFFQIDGWFFTLENFDRNTTNSGWLITNLIKVNDNDKTLYKKEILNID
jgi:hypothetical protein